MKNIILLFFVLFTFGAHAQNNPFEKNIAAFELADKSNPVNSKKLIVFTGSSSIVMWKTLAEDFPRKNVINRGFGGSVTSDLIELSDRVISAYKPKQVFIYEGDNDLNAGKTVTQVVSDFKTLFHKIREKDGKLRISFISIKPSPSRRKLLPQIKQTNQMIAAFLKTQKKTDFIDVFTPMLAPGEQMIPQLYLADSLHMTSEGYKIWKRVVSPYLR